MDLRETKKISERLDSSTKMDKRDNLPPYNKAIGAYRFIFSIIEIVLHFRSIHPDYPRYAFWEGVFSSCFFLYISEDRSFRRWPFLELSYMRWTVESDRGDVPRLCGVQN